MNTFMDETGPSVRPGRPLAVVFDCDDTLWSTEQLYDDARSAAAAIVSASGIDPWQWEKVERQLDVENVATLGHNPERFPTSCVQAYVQLCEQEGRAPDRSVVDAVREVARSVFERVAPVVPDAREAIGRLRAGGVRLALLTKGDAEIQSPRVDTSGLRQLFDLVEIVPEKSPAIIASVVAALGGDTAHAWMVGNSVRSDVLPALAAGLRAVWVDAHVWEYERAHDHLVDDRAVVAASLAEIPDLVLSRA